MDFFLENVMRTSLEFNGIQMGHHYDWMELDLLENSNLNKNGTK